MMDLALHSGGSAVSLKDVARRQAISEKYLWQVVAPLKAAGLVASVRGARGGYRLNQPARGITVRRIVEVLEGDIVCVDCCRDPSACDRVFACTARDLWTSLSEGLARAMEAVTLEELAEKQRRRCQDAPVSYEI